MTQRSDCLESPAREPTLSVVGAPLIESFTPLSGTAPARFAAWLPDHAARITDSLHKLVNRWSLMGAFVVVRFLHPTRGPAGAVTLSTTTLDTDALHHRLRRLTVIPLTDVAPFVPGWERGETVLVEVADMPSVLARRYAATPVRWSLNVPVMSDDTWVGVVGAVNGPEGISSPAVSGFETLTAWLTWEFEADNAWADFVGEVGSSGADPTQSPATEERGKRLLRLLR